MIAVYHVLRGDALLAGTNRDGHTMFITTTNKQYILLLQSQVTHVNVGWNIDSSQMTNVYAAIGIGQCRRNGCSFEFLFCHYIFF